MTRGQIRLRFRRHRPSDAAGQDAYARVRVHSARLPCRGLALSRHVAAGQPLQGPRADRGAGLSPEPVLRGGRHVRPLRGDRARARDDPRDPRGDRRGAEGEAKRASRRRSSSTSRATAISTCRPTPTISPASSRIRTTIRRRSRRRSRNCRKWRRNEGPAERRGGRVGACRCGRVRFEITKSPLITMACHCTGCQRMTASAFSLGVAVPEDGFRVNAGETAVGGLHGAIEHRFCAHCMSWLFSRMPGAGFVNVRSALLDGEAWKAAVRRNLDRRKAAMGADDREIQLPALPGTGRLGPYDRRVSGVIRSDRE